MTETQIDSEGTEHLPLKDFAEKAYLDYSMYVILDRALPHLADGLKPVQRRIVFAMSELGLSAGSKPKKSARTVGDVIGKYHPHGDSACYEAMVLMAQPFSYRYPLIDGQGNFGSQDDPKSFAAMRYTESRLTPYAKALLSELAQGTVDWQPNFDGTMEEPRLLPARLPNVLLNGSTGIAVGMSTDIPPHNLREVVSACIRLLENSRTTVEELCEHVQGPDYPTDAEIVSSRAELREIYRTGSGSVRMRARYEREGQDVVITALPYQVSGARVLEQMAQQIQSKKLPMVEDLRDESDHEHPTRLVIVPRSNRVDVDELMSHLFATTELERTYRVNVNVIGLNGKPQTRDLKSLLGEWLEFRQRTVRRRLEWRLDKVLSRLHILEGLLIAFLNIDEVIAIIRREDEPKPVLMARFSLSDTQAEAILELRLRHLARLEEMKIRGEQDQLAAERDNLQKTLGSDTRMKTLIRKELMEDAEAYGDARRTPIVERAAAQALSEAALTPAESVTVILSEKGWVRAAKGHDLDCRTMAYKAGDAFLAAAQGRSNQSAVFFDSAGRSYALPAHTLPSARSLGEPLTGKLSPGDGVGFIGVLMAVPEARVLLAADSGYGFICPYEEMQSKTRVGKALLNLPEGAQALAPAVIVPDVAHCSIAAITQAGHMLVIQASELPELTKGRGNKIIEIPTGLDLDRLAYVVAIPDGAKLRLHAGAKSKLMDADALAEYRGTRGRKGRVLPRGFQTPERIEVEG